jgi:uncharacterized protein YndB with AHSA1/START domain
MSVTHAEFTIERRYPQTPAQTFSAFADPELRRRWFVRPGFEWELDFRVGGTERNERRDPHRLFRARFHDIVEAERIVYTYDLEHDHRLISISLATIQFSAEPAGTLLRFTEQGVFFDGPHAAAEREHGTDKLLLAALDELFASEPVR